MERYLLQVWWSNCYRYDEAPHKCGEIPVISVAAVVMCVFGIWQTSVSIRRLQSFLSNEELDSGSVIRKPDIGRERSDI